jgi:hypothetical protein
MADDGLGIESDLEATQEELANIKKVLSTLIIWLQRELGEHNCRKLLDELED